MRFLVSHVGECSFCGRRDRQASAFAGVAHRIERICGACLGYFLDVVDEHDKREAREALAAQLARFDPERVVDEATLRKFRSGDVDGVLEFFRERGYELDEHDLRAFMKSRQSPRSCGIGLRRRPAAADACSFCDSPRSEVAELVEARGVAICDRCVDDASADVLDALVTT